MTVEVPHNNPEGYGHDRSIPSNYLVADIHWAENNGQVLSLGPQWEYIIFLDGGRKHFHPQRLGLEWNIGRILQGSLV